MAKTAANEAVTRASSTPTTRTTTIAPPTVNRQCSVLYRSLGNNKPRASNSRFNNNRNHSNSSSNNCNSRAIYSLLPRVAKTSLSLPFSTSSKQNGGDTNATVTNGRLNALRCGYALVRPPSSVFLRWPYYSISKFPCRPGLHFWKESDGLSKMSNSTLCAVSKCWNMRFVSNGTSNRDPSRIHYFF